MDGSLAINLGSLAVAFAAVILSSILTWRTQRLVRNANHFPVVVSLMAPSRDPGFKTKEDLLLAGIGHCDAGAGLDGIPEPLRAYFFEVSEQYHMLGYVMIHRLADGDLLVRQVGYRAIQVWEAIESHVKAERRRRGGEFSYLNSFERFVDRARQIDMTVPSAENT